MRSLALILLIAFPLAAADQPPSEQEPILAHLNQAIGWYRRLSAQAQVVTEPSDVIFVDHDVQLARQAVAQAFDGARALAALAGAQASSQDAKSRLSQRAAAATDAAQKAQAQVDAIERQLAGAPRHRKALADQLAEMRSELAFAQARAQALKTLADFSAQVGAGSAGLAGQIDELERSVPEVRAQPAAAPQPSAAAPSVAKRTGQGVIGFVEELFAIGRKEREIRESLAQTAQLRGGSEKLRAPLGAQLRTTLQQGEQLAAAPETTDPRVLADRKEQLDRITTGFKRISGALLPLGKEGVLLDAVRANLSQWDASSDGQSRAVLRRLAVRAGILLALIALLMVGSELWRRATFKYVHDPRRRQVSLLVRRIAVTAAVAIAVVLSLVSEIGSLATFAGFITAGLAVALQNVILSVAAYFFLIGKYGLRVGERVQIGNVVGDVLEIGLVRLHVLELGPDGLPTGRVVVFSNSVVFSGPNLFKPLPGTSFAWHQIKVTLAADVDHLLAEQRLNRAVQSVVDGYRGAIERQHAEVEQDLPVALQPPSAQTRLHLTEAGLEMLVRYPVPLEDAAAVDDRVTRALLDAIEHEPRLRLAGGASATLQPAQ